MSCIANGAAGKLPLSNMKNGSAVQELICQNPQGISTGRQQTCPLTWGVELAPSL